MNIGREVAAMQRMTVADLRQKHAEVFGKETLYRADPFSHSPGSADSLAHEPAGRAARRSVVLYAPMATGQARFSPAVRSLRAPPSADRRRPSPPCTTPTLGFSAPRSRFG